MKTLTLQERLKKLISEKEIMIKDLASMLGVSPRTIENYINGKTVPKTYEKELTMYEIIDVLYSSLPPKKPKPFNKYRKLYRGFLCR